MLRAAKTRTSKAKSPYMRSRADPTTTTSATVVARDQLRAHPPTQATTVTYLQAAPMDQVANVPASVGQCTDIFPTNPAALNGVTDALGAHIPINIKQAIFSNKFILLHKLLPTKASEKPQQRLVFVNGEIVIKPKTK